MNEEQIKQLQADFEALKTSNESLKNENESLKTAQAELSSKYTKLLEESNAMFKGGAPLPETKTVDDIIADVFKNIK